MPRTRKYEVLELTSEKAVIITTVRRLRTRGYDYRYIPVLNPLPFEAGEKVLVVIKRLE